MSIFGEKMDFENFSTENHLTVGLSSVNYP